MRWKSAPVLRARCSADESWIAPGLTDGERVRAPACAHALSAHHSAKRLLRQLHGATLVFVGDSIAHALFLAVMCVLWPESGINHSSRATSEWYSGFVSLLRARVQQLNASPGSKEASLYLSYLQRLATKHAPDIHRVGLAAGFRLPASHNVTVAFVDGAMGFGHGGPAPVHVRTRYLTDLVIPTLPDLQRQLGTKGRLILALNTGMVENSASATMADIERSRAFSGLEKSTTELTKAFLSMQDQHREARLLLIDSTPQHFATPHGLYRSGVTSGLPCRGSLDGAAASNATYTPANFRNIAKVRGAAVALAADRSTKADVRIVRQWQGLATLSGAAAHGHVVNGTYEQPPMDVKSRTRDCTHDSPDSMVYQLQALLATL